MFVRTANICWLALTLLACDGGETVEPAPGSTQDWPSFGRDHHNTRANLDESRITASTVKDLAPRWELPLEGCTSTPAVVDGIVYVGDWEGNLHAVRAEDGSVVWKKGVSDRAIDPSVLVEGDRLFIGDAGGDFHAVDRHSGDLLWSTQLDAHPATHIYGSAAYVDGLVIVGVAGIELVLVKDDYTFRGSLVALDAQSGDEVWRVYMTEDDPTSGAGVSVWSSPAIDTDRQTVYIGTGNTYEAPASLRADGLIAVDYTNGDVRWVRQFTADDVYTIFLPPPKGPDADVGAAPNLFSVGESDYVGVGDKAGVFSVLDRDSGETIWAKQVTPGSHLGGVMSSAAYAEGVIYVTSNEFASEDLATVLDEPVPEDTHSTVAFDAASGDELWRVVQPYPSVGGLTYAGGVVYHSSVDGTVHGLDSATGDELWSHHPSDSMASGSSIADGALFVSHGFRFFTSNGDVGGGLTAYGL